MYSPLNRSSRFQAAAYKAGRFSWRMEKDVGIVTIDRPDRKNPLAASLAEAYKAFAAKTRPVFEGN